MLPVAAMVGKYPAFALGTFSSATRTEARDELIVGLLT